LPALAAAGVFDGAASTVVAEEAPVGAFDGAASTVAGEEAPAWSSVKLLSNALSSVTRSPEAAGICTD